MKLYFLSYLLKELFAWEKLFQTYVYWKLVSENSKLSIEMLSKKSAPKFVYITIVTFVDRSTEYFRSENNDTINVI